MQRVVRFLFAVLLGASVTGFLGGCKTTEQAEEEQQEDPASARASVQPNLSAPSENIRTIQLYAGEDERSLPIVTLDSETALTLEFDLMEERGRPLSIYFQHADRQWRRDLTDSQILESFQDDRLLDYRSSRGTEVSYTHYVYRFPNDDIRFRMSGNYVLRVTERGRRDSVLFEQAFFVTEETGTLHLGSQSFLVPSQRYPSIQPVAEYTPPAEIRGDPFGYSVCFVQNGRLPDARCETRPQLVSQPQLEFELERNRAFTPLAAGYGLDLSDLRSTREIARTDRTVTPLRVLLDPDYARFDESTLGPDVNGQIIVRGALSNHADPALTAEYVQTRFAFVPSHEQPYGSELMVAGSFSGMDPARGTTMEWNGAQGQYEGTVLLKQGQYQYFYATEDSSLAREIERSRSEIRSTYMAFVYYRDAQYDTDRLLRVNGFTP